VWPAGLTGSITHTGDFVSVAIARATAVRAIGLDAERIVDPDRSRRVAPMIVQPGEAADGDEEAPGPVRVTLIFSIKEAVFKCLYPLVRERFYYPALLVTALDFSTGVFGAELAVSLPGLPAGHHLSGRFHVDDDRVYAGICRMPDGSMWT